MIDQDVSTCAHVCMHMCACVHVCVCTHMYSPFLPGTWQAFSHSWLPCFFNYFYLTPSPASLHFFTSWNFYYFPVNSPLCIFSVASFSPRDFYLDIFTPCLEVSYILVRSFRLAQQLSFSFSCRKSFLCCTENSMSVFLSFRKGSVFWGEKYSAS